MTVCMKGSLVGTLAALVGESKSDEDSFAVKTSESIGHIHEGLRIGVNVSQATALRANQGLSAMGMILVGDGFLVSADDPLREAEPEQIHPYMNGRDLMQSPRGIYVIDLFGKTSEEVRQTSPGIYQRLLHTVKPERDANRDRSLREKWWLFRRTNIQLRKAIAGLPRYIGTCETAKHRVFCFIPGEVIPDQKIRVVGLQDGFALAILSSHVHIAWAFEAGATLEDRPVYNNTTCFDPYPFPATTDEQQARLRELGERLDSHRKRQQSAYPDLTLTGMYNVLEKLRSGEALSAKERVIHEQGLVSVLRQIHDELDAAVLAAYGWSDLLPTLRIAHGNDAPPAGQSRDEAKRAFDEAVLERLVALNAERAAEEARGLVRWLRPEFQAPDQQRAPEQGRLATDQDDDAPADTEAAPAPAAKPRPWPKDAVEQVRAVADTLAASPAPLSLDQLAERFTARGPWKRRLPQLLDMLVALGRAQEDGGRYTAR